MRPERLEWGAKPPRERLFHNVNYANNLCVLFILSGQSPAVQSSGRPPNSPHYSNGLRLLSSSSLREMVGFTAPSSKGGRECLKITQ